MTTTTPSELHRKALSSAMTAYSGLLVASHEQRMEAAITAYQAAIGAEPVASPIAAGLKEIIKAGTSTDEFEQWEVFSKEAQLAKAMLEAFYTAPAPAPRGDAVGASLAAAIQEKPGADTRGAFERWAVKRGLDVSKHVDEWSRATVYNHPHIESMWAGWNGAVSPPTDRSGE